MIMEEFTFDFNPRSRERSDVNFMQTPLYGVNFNPRSRERSDKMMMIMFSAEKISIHAPARGATIRHGRVPHKFKNFNPRSRERSDIPPRSIFAKFSYFNPRSRERSDYDQINVFESSFGFQSTLPREERQQYCTKNLFIFIQYRQ